jgi:hypothetical protein
MAFKSKFPRVVARALFIEAEIEAKEAKKRTPVDLGNLRGSIHVTEPVIVRQTMSVSIVAGGPSAPYAIYVHEDLEAFHQVGQAQFIESVIMESRPFMAARVARRIDLSRALA